MLEQQINPELLEHTRREIARLLAEIEQLAGLDIPPDEFQPQFLRRLHSALAAHASALWLRNPQGHLQLSFQYNVQDTGVLSEETSKPHHDELLRMVATRAVPAVFGPHAVAEIGDDFPSVSNPTGYLLVLAPMVVENQVIGVVETFQPGDRRAQAVQGYQRFLVKCAAEAAKYFQSRRFRQFVGQERIWNQLDAFIRSIHAGLNPKQTAYLIANDGKRLIGAERVSVALLGGKRARIEAISGQDTVEKKSNLVRRMARLTESVLRHGETLLYVGVVEADCPRDVARALSDYLEESNSRLVAVVPMPDQRVVGQRAKPATAALIVEMIEDEAIPDELVGRIDVVARHGAIALYNAVENHRIFLRPLWKALGSATSMLTASRLPMTLSVVALLLVATATMVFMPWPLRLEGKGELLPKVRRTIYAPVTGLVETVKVDHGAPVSVGTELLRLSNPQLEQELLGLKGDLEAKEKNLSSLKDTSRDPRRRDRTESDREASKMAELNTEIAHLRNRVRLVNAQLETLRLTSPIAGQVMNWNPKETLPRRPVQQGDALLEVAQVAGDWHLEIHFPEKVAAHIARAKALHPDKKPTVTFLLSSAPDVTYTGTLVELATQAEPVEKENVVLGKIRLDGEIPAALRRSGTEVRVKVDCGPYPVGYVLLREVIDFVREKVFF